MQIVRKNIKRKIRGKIEKKLSTQNNVLWLLGMCIWEQTLSSISLFACSNLVVRNGFTSKYHFMTSVCIIKWKNEFLLRSDWHRGEGVRDTLQFIFSICIPYLSMVLYHLKFGINACIVLSNKIILGHICIYGTNWDISSQTNDNIQRGK